MSDIYIEDVGFVSVVNAIATFYDWSTAKEDAWEQEKYEIHNLLTLRCRYLYRSLKQLHHNATKVYPTVVLSRREHNALDHFIRGNDAS